MHELFSHVTPESVGIHSSDVLELIKTFDERRMHTHGIIMARGEEIFAECYYKPFHENFLHRMYSVSKSFVAIAVGVAVTEGLMSLDDVIVDYFPEFRNENTDEYFEKCTVRDMLMMRSNVGTLVKWWGKFDSRVAAYYSQISDKLPGGLYKYDSIGSFLLGCIIEKLTGKTFLEYLKEKVLLDMGFSRESYVLREPGGYAIGDSGVMCTTRDLFIFARLIMRGGEFRGKQYIDPEFMKEAIKRQVNNDNSVSHGLYSTAGYGYLIWRYNEDGFALVGMGDQLAICDMKRDICFVITSDNQAERSERHIIFHELTKHFFKKASDGAIPENCAIAEQLRDYLTSRKLVAQYGEATSPISKSVFKKRYEKVKGELDIDGFTLNDGKIELIRNGKPYSFEFGVLENKETKFSFGERAKADMMGVYVSGEYDCNASGGWISEDTFSIMLHVTDTYFGALAIQIAFEKSEASLRITRSGQYVFEGIDGYSIFKTEE